VGFGIGGPRHEHHHPFFKLAQGIYMELITTEILALFFAALRSATPVLAVVLGEIMTQRSGIINLGVEGQMLVGAMTGFAVTATTGDPWLGVLAACGAGMLLSLVHAVLVLGCQANQIASGVAVMILGGGLSAFYGIPYVGEKINSFGSFKGSAVTDLPVIGEFLVALTSTILITLVSIPLISVFLYRTIAGLHWRSVGESAGITRNLGHSPVPYQFAAIVFGGLMSGFAGAALAVDYTSNWVEYMTSGRGLVAVGLVIVARWNPWYALPAALLFGVSESLNLRLQSWGVDISPYLLATLPYLIPLVVLMLSFRGLKAGGGGMPKGLKAVFQGN
jgi:simple sugar transport system permease protein